MALHSFQSSVAEAGDLLHGDTPYDFAVKIVTFVDSLWSLNDRIFSDSEERTNNLALRETYEKQELVLLVMQCFTCTQQTAFQIIENLLDKGCVELAPLNTLRLNRSAFCTMRVALALYGPHLRPHQIRYFISIAIRDRFQISLNAETRASFNTLATIWKQIIVTPSESGAIHFTKTVRGRLEQLSKTLRVDFDDLIHRSIRELKTPNSRELVGFFLHCAFLVPFLWPIRKWGSEARTSSKKTLLKRGVQLASRNVDAEYLIAMVFGLPTSIPGLDYLFGGGGIQLSPCFGSTQHENTLPARSILVRGGYGTGKSLFAMSLAVEVASHGGVVWYFPLEISSPEAEYILATLGVEMRPHDFRIATNHLQVERLLAERANQSARWGILCILSIADVTFSNMSNVIKSYADRSFGFSMSLTVIDPINTILTGGKAKESEIPSDDSATQQVSLRQRTHDLLQYVKSSGNNLLFTVEEADGSHFDAEEALADTVLFLSSEEQHGYRRRYVSVMKSRYQREHRGRHAFTIVPGSGISITPSVAAIAATNSHHSADRQRHVYGAFGLSSLDKLLSPRTSGKHPVVCAKSVFPGDVILLRGSIGTFKTHLALCFVSWCARVVLENQLRDHRLAHQAVGLVISQRYPRDVIMDKVAEPVLSATFRNRRESLRKYSRSRTERALAIDKPVLVKTISGGYADPGAILWDIECTLESARASGKFIDRVFLDVPADWADTCPFLNDNDTFAQTLIDCLRRRGITVIITDRMSERRKNSKMFQTFLDAADTLIDLGQFQHKGKTHAWIRVERSHTQEHLNGTFQFAKGRRSGLHVDPYSDLARINEAGSFSCVGIRFFVPLESARQCVYFDNLVQFTRSAVGAKVTFDKIDRSGVIDLLRHDSTSVVDELQIVGIDEYMLDDLTKARLRPIPKAIVSACPVTNERIASRTLNRNGRCVALPFYDNVSFMVFNRTRLSNALGRQIVHPSWEDILELCRIQHASSDVMPFDFPRGAPESVNCLFLEIVGSLMRTDGRELMTSSIVKGGLSDKDLEVCVRAGRILSEIAKPKMGQRLLWRLGASEKSGSARDFRVNTRAIVVRQWFTTFMQFMDDLVAEHDQTDDSWYDWWCAGLPGGVCTAGQWYLGIPNGSAAPRAGFRLLSRICSSDAENARWDLGVGIPTYSGSNEADLDIGMVSQEVHISGVSASFFRSLSANPIERSKFHQYAELSSRLGQCLQEVVYGGLHCDESQGLARIRGLLKLVFGRQ